MKRREAYTEEEIIAVYRLCFSYLKNTRDTEDVVRTTFEKYLNRGGAV